MAILRFLGRVMIILSVALTAIGVFVWLDGRGNQPAGQVWFDMHQFSLNYAQVIVQRHLGLESFWFDQVLPYLQRPAWEAILWGVIATLVAGGFLLWLGRARRRRRTGGL
ncbi:MAG: hypothetical protein RIM33_04085 [Alphaproteobacteria bacterium]